MFKIDSLKRFLPYVFFLFYLILGLIIYRDYGLSWDEPYGREHAQVNYNYIVRGDKALFSYEARNYGVAFELPLLFLEKNLPFTSNREIYFFRHIMTFFLFWISAIFFYKIIKKSTGNIFLGLSGVIFLLLSPRIFADSFYNAKDIPFMCGYLISIYTLVLFLENYHPKNLFFHALSTAFAIAIRSTGVIIVAITLFVITLDLILRSKKLGKPDKKILFIPLYLVSFFIITVIIWPYLWSNPLNHFREAFGYMSNFQVDRQVLFLGNYLTASHTPRYYLPVWMVVTIPVVYFLLFFIGEVIILTKIFFHLFDFKKYAVEMIFLCYFTAPFFAAIIFHTPLYDGWRQMYFIYPPFLLIGVQGLRFITSRKNLYFKYTSLTILMISILPVLYFMIQYHPYQNMYFNIFAGGMKNAKQNFDLDYWGLTFRKGLEYILATDKSKNIPILLNYGSDNAAEITGPEGEKRLRLVYHAKDAKYILTNYRLHKEEYNTTAPEVFNILIDNIRIMSVYKLY